MRIVIDLQGAQSTGSRTRGIGRYSISLAQSLLRNRAEHEIFLVLNGLFPETIEQIRSQFQTLISQDHILVWNAPGPTDHLHGTRRREAEAIREMFMAQLSPDVILVSSLFEGLTDNAVTSIGSLVSNIPTAAVLFDLIPFINQTPYLENPDVKRWYFTKLDHLRRADLLLAISDSSRLEAIDYLGWASEAVVSISTAADPHFVPRSVTSNRKMELFERYGLNGSFIMYTGGIDYRKNIEGLIFSYAKLNDRLRSTHQLAIICSVGVDDKRRLLTLANDYGLSPRELVFTGFVSEEDLIDLYNSCALFVFPSWHEGFGLPALEAMSCGAPVIGANTSSLPEVIGREAALFNPRDYSDITNKMSHALTDQTFRTHLIHDGLAQAKSFSWDKTAKRAILAIEKLPKRGLKSVRSPSKRPKLAYVSPLQPEKSGISEYSSELLPELNRHYEVEVIVAQPTVTDSFVSACSPIRSVDWFRENSFRYDRVLYHFGNSAFHMHMFDLLSEIPGIVVLHDFFLSGVLHYMDASDVSPGIWVRELYNSHGYSAVIERFTNKDLANVIRKYPCSLSVLRDADGVIVHAENSLRLARHWYDSSSERFEVIPHLRIATQKGDRKQIRRQLGIDEDQIVVSSFGFIAPTKMNHDLLKAWSETQAARNGIARLFFVGANDEGTYGQGLLSLIRKLRLERCVTITGWTDTSDFQRYLAASDIAVQLRTDSRGETSGAVLDCMNHGLPTVVNANGSMADLDDDSILKLPDKFDLLQLTRALDMLSADEKKRRDLGNRARERILTNHTPRKCAEQYFVAIERFNAASRGLLQNFSSRINSFDHPLDDYTLADLSTIIRGNRQQDNSTRRLLVDVSELAQGPHDRPLSMFGTVIARHLTKFNKAMRIEPIRRSGETYVYARAWTLNLLKVPTHALIDAPVELRPNDVYLGVRSLVGLRHREDFLQLLRSSGVTVEILDVTSDQFDSVIAAYANVELQTTGLHDKQRYVSTS